MTGKIYGRRPWLQIVQEIAPGLPVASPLLPLAFRTAAGIPAPKSRMPCVNFLLAKHAQKQAIFSRYSEHGPLPRVLRIF